MIAGGFSNFLFFNSPILLKKINRLELKNVIFDDVYISEALEKFVDNPEWNYDTVIYAKFQNTLNASKSGGGDIFPEKLLLRKRKKDSNTWDTVKMFDYVIGKERYNYRDDFVESLEQYVYSVVPVVSGILGTGDEAEIETNYEGIYFVSKEKSISFQYNAEINDVGINGVSNQIHTLGSKYPFIINNSNTSYKTFSVKATLITSDSRYGIDRMNEKKYRQQIEAFLDEKNAKVLKDGNSGLYSVVSVVPGSIILTPRNELGRQIFDISFTCVEIDNCDYNSLSKYGFVEVV